MLGQLQNANAAVYASQPKWLRSYYGVFAQDSYKVTSTFTLDYGLRWDLLVMRSRGDYAQVTEFKQSVVEDLRARGFDLRLAFEDDPQNHAMFQAEGIPCVYIHSGYYE